MPGSRKRNSRGGQYYNLTARRYDVLGRLLAGDIYLREFFAFGNKEIFHRPIRKLLGAAVQVKTVQIGKYEDYDTKISFRFLFYSMIFIRFLMFSFSFGSGSDTIPPKGICATST